MNFKKFFFLLAFMPFMASAQNCIKPFNTNCWFNQVSQVRISDDGSRILAWNGTGPYNGSNATTCNDVNWAGKVYRVTDTGLVLIYGQSNGGGPTGFSDFTGKNGIYYVTSGIISYRSAGGVSQSISGAYSSPSLDIMRTVGNPNKMIVRNGVGNKAYILNDADTANPTITTVTLPGPTSASGCEENVVAASFTDNRIYYVSTESGGGSLTPAFYRQKIKCTDTLGNPVAGWNDVVIQRGRPSGIFIRPTDGRVFVQINSNEYHYAFHAVVVFDKFGNLSTDMNMTDLSVLGDRWSAAEKKIRFDAQGNIYGNAWAHSSWTSDMGTNPLGLMRFDSKGNLDLGFMRNAWNSYATAESVGTSSFDISEGGIIIKATYPTIGYRASSAYALSPDHINSNNEDPTNTYSSDQAAINTWGTYAVFRNAPNSNYAGVQFLFSSGRLVLPGMTAAQISENCGIATPVVVPQRDPAKGTIQCNGLSFIAAPVQGTLSTLVLKVPVDVTAAGVFSPITVSGSGMTMQDPYATFSTTAVGLNDFYLTLKYDGSTLGTFNISVGGAGSCSADLADQTKNNPSVVPIWTPENCTYKVIGPDLK